MSDTVTTSVARLRGVGLRYRKTVALDGIDLDIPPGCMVGLIGPDGVGKSSLLSLIAGARAVQTGTVTVLDGDIGDTRHRDRVCPHIAYMPQGLGKNLYPSLSVEENLQFFGRLFGHGPAERRRRIDELCTATGLQSFLDRPAGKLSGGMKQKLGLCCALIHDPDLLILDEPTTGVDPLSRNQFWDLITRIRQARPGMSVVVATAYMEEAERFDWLVAMNAGRVLATGTPAELHAQTGTNTLEAAFIALLPETVRQGHREVIVPPLEVGDDEIVAIEARDLTMRFGNFTAVDHASFRIRRGEIFGFLGSNGCGKSTTMKMLTGLLDASDGEAWLFGQAVDSSDIGTRRRVGYMSQAFSLYSELTVRQNLVLHARLYHVPAEQIPARVDEMVERFELASVLDKLPDALPLGIRQRLSLAVAMVHKPELLILDEPTSGVDPIARDAFWRLMIDLARKDKVTIFISTHFMNEATRCDRISLMHAGEVLVTDEPAELVCQRGSASLEAAFISYLEEAVGERHAPDAAAPVLAAETSAPDEGGGRRRGFSLMRVLSYSSREALELQRDPVRATLALVGSLILMFIMGYGISMDVDNLTFAVLDHDRSGTSRDYVLNLAGSRYFIERDPIRDHADMDRRMRNGELSLAIEIPPNFGRDLRRGDQVQIAAWVDGSMPARAETASGYVQGMHQTWLAQMVRAELGVTPTPSVEVEIRYRYNPDVESLQAMVPAVIPMLLMMIPAMLTALSVVREKELGSIINLYVTPVSRLEFLLGKQVPYIVLGMLNFLLLTLAAVTIFGVPLKGSFLLLAICSLAYIAFATGFGLFASTFTNSQLAAIFATMIGSMIPVVQFSGIITPVSSLEGVGRHIGEFYPATYMVMVSRGVFSKALGFADLGFAVYPIMASVPVILVAATLLLRKQAR